MDDGRLTDGQGRTVDFKNTVLIMTSNIPGGRDGRRGDVQAGVHQPARRHRRVPRAVTRAAARDRRPAGGAADRPRGRARRRRSTLTDAARDLLGDIGYDPTYGARPLKRVISKRLVDPLALGLLKGDFARRRPRSRSTPPTASWSLHPRAEPRRTALGLGNIRVTSIRRGPTGSGSRGSRAAGRPARASARARALDRDLPAVDGEGPARAGRAAREPDGLLLLAAEDVVREDRRVGREAAAAVAHAPARARRGGRQRDREVRDARRSSPPLTRVAHGHGEVALARALERRGAGSRTRRTSRSATCARARRRRAPRRRDRVKSEARIVDRLALSVRAPAET